MKIRLAVVLMATLAMALCSGLAHATTYQLTVDNCTGGCNPGAPGTSMGTVVVTGQGTTSLTVVITLVSPLQFVNTGLQQTIDFNLLGSPTVALGSTSNASFSLDSTTAGSEHFDGFGNFTYALKLNTAQGAGGAVASPETFVINCGAGCTSLTESANANGFFFGVDVYNSTRNTTGPIGTGGGTLTTPEPGSLVLFGSGLLGLAGILRRKLSI
jgi:hypothetical protein